MTDSFTLSTAHSAAAKALNHESGRWLSLQAKTKRELRLEKKAELDWAMRAYVRNCFNMQHHLRG
ncbi:MAG: hypothetical protein Q8S96_15245 [Hydrogenophaga sp.]|uniref:hypothetical protein n=1 Tax=Hydrogenophaga sp. TaxID=1904254 RepID=UPI002726CB8F|nr:hypothetical protein [Hydrogenophaga sp.]MDO9481723.1 hypothetical protein [Hydrogenophaga sp.]MDP3345790.1 hypothetical protein [Hydrogenophaga sp.]MDP3805086.1 hypothetical protein [Hydrogenophaga sp.]MDP3921890.1 hypothetical protein [Hydrogenophaga sp.]